jgi:hypothetical protein
LSQSIEPAVEFHISTKLDFLQDMDAANGDSDEVKALALDGNFDLITEKFGIKKCGKAENYAQAKLDSLREKVQRGQSLSSVLYATPFMTFALDHTDKKVRSLTL